MWKMAHGKELFKSKPWEVSSNDPIQFETTSSPRHPSFDIENSEKSTSSPEKGLKLLAPWPADFTIPTSMFSETLEKEAVFGSLSWSSKTELLKVIADKMLRYTSNPSTSQRDIYARQLFKIFPNLKSNIGEGHEGWAQKIYDKVKNEARKRGIFSYKRKIFNKDDNKGSNLEYSPKVQKPSVCEAKEDTVANLEVKEKMLIEMRKMPDFLYKMFPSETSMQVFSDTHVTPHLCIVGDPFSTSEAYVVAEKKNLNDCSDLVEGLVCLIGLYFVANIEFPKEAMATYKFFQSFILKLQCKNLPSKLITFCNSII